MGRGDEADALGLRLLHLGRVGCSVLFPQSGVTGHAYNPHVSTAEHLGGAESRLARRRGDDKALRPQFHGSSAGRLKRRLSVVLARLLKEHRFSRGHVHLLCAASLAFGTGAIHGKLLAHLVGAQVGG